ncbi:MAG: branched-chain-amino-acid transaminase [Candidatus Omnitrophota bacterium]
MGFKIYIDGKWYNKEDAKVSVFDHGLLYGDGVFEGIRSYNCLVFKLDEHIERLYESAHTIMLKIPLTKEELKAAVIESLKKNQLKDAYIRLIVTRGEGDLGLDPRKCKKAGVIIIADKINLYTKDFFENGLKVVTVPTARNLPEALNPSIKSLNYLNNIMAKIEAINAGVEEAIMLNNYGYVAECSGDNIFMIKKGILKTPPVYHGSLRGITRDVIIWIASNQGIEVQRTTLTRHDLFNADECFLTGTAAEIIPVVEVDGRTIGSGKVGEITKKLTWGFRESTKTEGVKYAL